MGFAEFVAGLFAGKGMGRRSYPRSLWRRNGKTGAIEWYLNGRLVSQSGVFIQKDINATDYYEVTNDDKPAVE